MTKTRRERGSYFTKKETAEKTAEIIKKYVTPTQIIEPYAGCGNLLLPFEGTPRVANELFPESYEQGKLLVPNAEWHNDNTLDYSARELIERWNIKSDENTLIYSNPPFGAASVNSLVNGSIEKGTSQKIAIQYRPELLIYGRGDLMLPTLGQMIEIIKELGKGYLAVYSIFGLYCGRVRYNKCLIELLSNFTFQEGWIFSGKGFEGISQMIPVAFTVFKYGGQTQHLDLEFWFDDEV